MSQLHLHFFLRQGQDKDIEITPILTSLKTWNPYLTVFITTLHMTLKKAVYHIRIFLNNTRKKYLTRIAFEILLNRPFIRTDLTKFQYHSFIFNTIDTKLYELKTKEANTKICTHSKILQWSIRTHTITSIFLVSRGCFPTTW